MNSPAGSNTSLAPWNDDDMYTESFKEWVVIHDESGITGHTLIEGYMQLETLVVVKYDHQIDTEMISDELIFWSDYGINYVEYL